MQNQRERSKIAVVDGYLLCPICHRKLQRVPPDMAARNLPVYCGSCKIEYSVNIEASPSPLRPAPQLLESEET